MGSTRPNKQVMEDLSPFFLIYDDGTIERLSGTDFVPPSFDQTTGVTSRDVLISPDSGVSARLYLPNPNGPPRKLPLLVYFHGGGFCIGTTACSIYHHHLNKLASDAEVFIVSVDYRRPPEHPLPTAYDDSWAVLNWAVTQAHEGSDPWFAAHVDVGRIFIGGDSAGGNIAHNVAMRAGESGLAHGAKLDGMALVHPYFWGEELMRVESTHPMKAVVDRVWTFANPGSSGLDDPMINPVGPGAPSLTGLGCGRVLVCVAEMDVLSGPDWMYHEALVKSGWDGETSVSSKDIIIFADTGVSARLYLPKLKNPDEKLPLVVYFHGRGLLNGLRHSLHLSQLPKPPFGPCPCRVRGLPQAH
ncbi:putative carboxylesterase 2 [Acorus gramineus]|uniref:Carboxylesterase 2 n=1 Tax=Acorus gramineus TaxID=55184 RepID=A0AAV9BA80_ACOGR|nr:putative carboxylesterase 2 [Acorus gramineus]